MDSARGRHGDGWGWVRVCERRVPYHLVHLENTQLSDSPSSAGHIDMAPQTFITRALDAQFMAAGYYRKMTPALVIMMVAVYMHKHSLVTGQAFELCANNLKHLNARASLVIFSGRGPAESQHNMRQRLSVQFTKIHKGLSYGDIFVRKGLRPYSRCSRFI